MRTNIVLDDELIERARQLTGIKTKREVIRAALRTLIQVQEQAEVGALRGKLNWVGNLDESRQVLAHLIQVQILNQDLAVQSAQNYRMLRKIGITIRKTIDCFIATYYIANGHQLLHSDRDFDSFEDHLGLQVFHQEEV